MLTVRLSPSHASEKQYVLHVLLCEILGVEFSIEYHADKKSCELSTPSGYRLIIEDHFFSGRTQGQPYSISELPQRAIPIQGLLPDLPMMSLFGNERVERGDRTTMLGADLLASAFFMLTRWEESVRPERDEYGRFPGQASLAWRTGFLHRPVVEEWAEVIRILLHLPPKAPAAHPIVLSCDVDHPQLWAPPLSRMRTLAGALWRDVRSGTVSETRWWMQEGLGQLGDPFDTFDELMSWGEQNNTPVQFNFLSKRPRHYDCWYDLGHPFVQQLLAQILQRGHITGFHPSRQASRDPVRFGQELSDLRTATRAEVTTGRHHYLMFDAPDTWQLWENHQMKTDSTAGYADVPGFRCGICRPFSVFNFHTRVMLRLQEQPLIAMEVTFAHYLRSGPEQTLQALRELKQQCVKYGGEFTLLWHNSSLNTPFWASYRPVFEQILC